MVVNMGCKVSRVSPAACALFTSLTRMQLFPITGYIACEISKSVFIGSNTDIPDTLEQVCGVFSTLIFLASLYVLYKDKFTGGQLMAPPSPTWSPQLSCQRRASAARPGDQSPSTTAAWTRSPKSLRRWK